MTISDELRSTVRVDDLLAGGLTRSFEFFPPKNDGEDAILRTTLDDLETLTPSFVSVTYRGGRESRQRTFDLVTEMQRAGNVTAMAHLICVGHQRSEMRDLLKNYADAGVENVMALGGDVPDDPALAASDFTYALELVELAREMGPFCVGVGAHPLGHPRSTNRVADRRHLAEKLTMADFAVTQFFFDVGEWTTLVGELEELSCDKPVIPGIMPVTSLGSIDRMQSMGAPVPRQLASRLSTAHQSGGPAAVRDEGIRAATELCRGLLEAGAPGLHFYTLNRSTATREIHQNLFG